MTRAADLPNWSCPKIDEAQRALSAAGDHFAQLDQFDDPGNLEQTIADGDGDAGEIARQTLRQTGEW